MKSAEVIDRLEQGLTATSFENRVALDRLRRAQKFEISVPAEALSVAIDYAAQMENFGIFDLPFPETYFEYQVAQFRQVGASVMGILCWSEGGILFGRGYCLTASGLSAGPYTFRLSMKHRSIPLVGNQGPIMTYDFNFRREARSISTFEQLRSSKRLQSKAQETLDVERAQFLEDVRGVQDAAGDRLTNASVGADLAIEMAFGAVGSLTLRGATQTKYIPDAALNRARVKRGRPPFDSHVVVKIPGHPAEKGGLPPNFFERAGPRLHWRRGHIRRLSSGVLTKVRPCLVGDRTAGIVTHDYELA